MHNTSAPLCVGDCVPDGFVPLAVTSVLVLLLMILLLVWAASPGACCACCGHMGQGFRDILRGARVGLLNDRTRDEGVELQEDWWELKPQTDREKELVRKRAQQEEEEAAAKNEKDD